MPAVHDADARAARGFGVIVLSSVLFGVMAVCVRLAARQLSALEIAFVRFLGLLVLLLAAGGGASLRPRTASLWQLLLRGLLGVGAVTLYFRGIQGAGAGLATLIHATYPVFTALFAVALLGERFSGRLGAAVVLNVVGVGLLLGPTVRLRPDVTMGGAVTLVGAILSGAAVATARHLRFTESALVITTYFMAVGAVATAPALATGLPPVSVGLGLTLAGVVLTSVGGQWLLHQGLGFTTATQGSLAAGTSVLTAAVLEAVFLGEHLGAHAALGASLMIAAVGLAATTRAA